jgi:hypothetical protein
VSDRTRSTFSLRTQKELTKLVQDKYQASVSPQVNLWIALVDLTEAKHHTPIFAGSSAFNPSNPGGGATVEGGSLVKILPLYAAYQLRFDLNTIAQTGKITKGSVLRTAIAKAWKKAGLQSRPKLTGLFQFVEKAGSPVEARLWREPAITWRSSPFPTLPRHSTTALSAATFFTLLAQGRLVDQASSSKCGILPPLYHEAIHVIRQPPAGKRLEYVAVVLSKKYGALNFMELGQDLDSIIAQQNL